MGYAKLFASITESSLWSEPKEVRLLFVTMLAKANAIGFVEASIPGLSRAANLTIEEIEKAIPVLENPDPYSKNPDCEGRRIIPAPGGWIVLNYEDYRSRQSEEERRDYMREYMRNYRKQSVNNVKRNKDFPSASSSASVCKGRGTEEESVQYCKTQGLTEDDGHWFFDKCQGSGWKNNGKPIADWQATVRSWKRIAIFPSQKGNSNGRVVRSMSSFEIKERVQAISAEINGIFKKNGGRVVGDGIDELKKRRDELQRQLLR